MRTVVAIQKRKRRRNDADGGNADSEEMMFRLGRNEDDGDGREETEGRS